jgi:quercetin dioxygenase-like cupin family protein
MEPYTFLADLRAEIEIPRHGILSRTLFSDERLKAVIFGFDVGQELSPHTAAVPAVIHILEGRAEVSLGDDRHEVGPGSWMRMPAGLRHGLVARTPVVMLLLLLKNEKHEDGPA